MSEQSLLLATICANPSDDAPRLIYADWLDEHDEPERATFIRSQCNKRCVQKYELDENGEASRPLQRTRDFIRLEKSERTAFRKGIPKWYRQLGEKVIHQKKSCILRTSNRPRQELELKFERGFADVAGGQANAWSELAERLLVIEPLISEVVLATFPDIQQMNAPGGTLYYIQGREAFDTFDECLEDWTSQWCRIRFLRTYELTGQYEMIRRLGI